MFLLKEKKNLTKLLLQLKGNSMKNLIYLLPFLLLASCKKDRDSETKNVYYFKVLSDENEILDYKIRKYDFISDTISEREITLTSNNRFYFKKSLFLKKNGNLFLITKYKDSVALEPYLTTKLDSCNLIKHPLGNYEICYQGRENFLNYKNCYKLDHTDVGIDGLSMTVFLDENYIKIAQIAQLATFSKDLRIDVSEVPKDIKEKLLDKL